MANSKTNPARNGKQQAFKQHQKAQAEKAASGRREQIVPSVLWESNDLLLIRGDLLEAYNKTVEVIFHGLQQMGQIYQQIVALNIQGDGNPDGKIRIKYQWNNGEDVSEKDLEVFKRKMAEMQALQQRQQEELQQKAAVLSGTKEKEPKSGLVTAEGAPLTQENVEQKNKIIS